MPTIRPGHPTQYVAGGRGDGGIVSVNKQPIIGPNASGQDWLTPDTLAVVRWPIDGQMVLSEVALDGRVLRDLWTARGINYMCAGGGHWAITTTDGVIIDGVNRGFTVAPIRYGANGVLAWFPWNGQGLWLDNQVDSLSTAAVADVRFHDGGWTWREGRTIRSTTTLTDVVIQTVTPEFYWVVAFRRENRWWLAYLASDWRIVAHPADDASNPRLLGTGLCYRLDASSEIAVWSAADRDLPDDLRIVPVVEPEPEPEPEPERTVVEIVQCIDPTGPRGLLAVKTIKPVAGKPGLFTLILPNDRVYSMQPDGSDGDRDPGTEDSWERCRISGNVATFRSVGLYYTRGFVVVEGL